MFVVHDPQSGVISAGQLPGFLKSVRCELVTFYEIARSRKAAYDAMVKSNPEAAFIRYAYFEIDPRLFGAFTLELKVTDVAGMGSGTALDYRQVLGGGAVDVTHVGPTLSGQGTNSLIWAFLLRQDAQLAGERKEGSPVGGDRNCYIGKIGTLDELELLAEGQDPAREAFTRIRIDAQKPLAAWLRDNGAMMSANFLAAPSSEVAEPAQMFYSFALQVSGGIEARYSLTNARWTPVAVQALATATQNSNLQLYINGPGAAFANAAKAGGAAHVPPPPPLGSSQRPMHVIVEGERQSGEGRSGGRMLREAPTPLPRSKGYFLTPLPVFPPAVTQ
ncbi:hypothetical protein [Bradyrhizobium icense]|uniref:hypothetical protein n=1 Tax=Bradyrhizobium icense TaxID=1274631 RepID=UPI0012EA4EAB|nr:hypothetical protein [Bradyrhizobium icense]